MERVEFRHEEAPSSPSSSSSYYDCRIPRPKLKFVIPTHSYGVSSSSPQPQLRTGRKFDIVDVSGFEEISLSDDNETSDKSNGNAFIQCIEDGDQAYGSGSGSNSSSSKSSSKFRSDTTNSSDDMLSEFEREQEITSLSNNNNETCRRFKSLKRSQIASFWSSMSLTSSSKSSSGNGSNNNGHSDVSHLVEIMKTVPLFRKLSSSFLTKLCDHVVEVNYDCGDYIVRQGTPGKGFYIMLTGTARMTFLSQDNGESIFLKTLHPGDIFGEKALAGPHKVNMMNVMTTDETASCLFISKDGFEELNAKNVDIKARLCSNKLMKSSLNEYYDRIELEDLRLVSTLGIGGFGRVELVTLASDPTKSFALKQMKKCQIVSTRQIEHIKSEKAILLETNCEFITKLYKTFKDSKYLYMLMECCLGGELWTILRDRGHFNDSTAKFYVGCVLETLTYLHGRNIIYRDLKPENLLLDSSGYLKLVDFGFAKKLEGNKTWTFCGTPEYVAPEIILNKGHGLTADFWSLGILMYELLTGTPPFVGGDPMRTYKLILKGIDYVEFSPDTISKNAFSLIRKLCRENPEDRLGASRGLSEIKKHKWFEGLDWRGLKSRTLTPPIIPLINGPHDCGNFDVYPPDRSGTPPDDMSGWDWDF